MAREKLGKTAVTLGLPPDMIDEIKAEASKSGTPWTTYIPVLLRKALDIGKAPARQPQASDL